MIKRILSLCLALCMIFALAACGSKTEDPAPEATEAAPEAAPAEAPVDDTVYELKFSSSQVTGSWLGNLIDEYAVMVDEATNGRVKITIYHDNALGAPADLWTMFTQGGLEILNMGIAQAGEFPITNIVQTPFLLTTPDTAGEVMYTLLEEGLLPEFSDNMHVLAFMPTDMQMIATVDDEITSVADFSGMKIRANSGILIDAIETLDATAVSITTTDVFLALSQGTIDGGISSPAAMDAFKWQDACDYLLNLPICTGMNYIGISLDTWESLPADLQEALDEVSQEFYAIYMEKNNAAQQECVDKMVEAGVTLLEPSEEFVAEIVAAESGLLDTVAAEITAAGHDGELIKNRVLEIVANSEYEK